MQSLEYARTTFSSFISNQIPIKPLKAFTVFSLHYNISVALITLNMNNNINEWAPLLDQRRFDSFVQIRTYRVELLKYWSKLIAYRLQTQTTEDYYDILASLTELATYIGFAGSAQHGDEFDFLTEFTMEQNSRERYKYLFLSEKILDMVRFLTSYPDMMQLSDVLKMYAVQLGRLRFLGGGLILDGYADGMDGITDELCPMWRQDPEHWHCAVWTELQVGMNS